MITDTVQSMMSIRQIVVPNGRTTAMRSQDLSDVFLLAALLGGAFLLLLPSAGEFGPIGVNAAAVITWAYWSHCGSGHPVGYCMQCADNRMVDQAKSS